MSHPHHLTSNWSSAFIPFCAYKSDLKMLGSHPALPGLSFPVCSSFIPTLLEGQGCYKLTLNETSGQGKRNELTLLLDYNEERSLQVRSDNNTVDSFTTDTLNLDTALESIQGVSAKVQINTLSPYIGFGGGIYSITDVKRMTAKEDFLTMPLKDRNCKVELYEDCRTRKLLEKCNCVPWEAPGHQVKHNSIKDVI